MSGIEIDAPQNMKALALRYQELATMEKEVAQRMKEARKERRAIEEVLVEALQQIGDNASLEISDTLSIETYEGSSTKMVDAEERAKRFAADHFAADTDAAQAALDSLTTYKTRTRPVKLRIVDASKKRKRDQHRDDTGA